MRRICVFPHYLVYAPCVDVRVRTRVTGDDIWLKLENVIICGQHSVMNHWVCSSLVAVMSVVYQ